MCVRIYGWAMGLWVWWKWDGIKWSRRHSLTERTPCAVRALISSLIIHFMHECRRNQKHTHSHTGWTATDSHECINLYWCWFVCMFFLCNSCWICRDGRHSCDIYHNSRQPVPERTIDTAPAVLNNLWPVHFHIYKHSHMFDDVCRRRECVLCAPNAACANTISLKSCVKYIFIWCLSLCVCVCVF